MEGAKIKTFLTRVIFAYTARQLIQRIEAKNAKIQSTRKVRIDFWKNHIVIR